MRWLLLPAFLNVTGCGPYSELDAPWTWGMKPKKATFSSQVQNNGAGPITLTLSLWEFSSENQCKPYSNMQSRTAAAGTTELFSIYANCKYPSMRRSIYVKDQNNQTLFAETLEDSVDSINLICDDSSCHRP